MTAPKGLEFVAKDIALVEGNGQLWLLQNGKHYPFPPNMEFNPDQPIVDLAKEGYIQSEPYCEVTTIRVAE